MQHVCKKYSTRQLLLREAVIFFKFIFVRVFFCYGGEGGGAFSLHFFLLQSCCSSWRLFEAKVFGSSNYCRKVKTVAAAMDQAIILWWQGSQV